MSLRWHRYVRLLPFACLLAATAACTRGTDDLRAYIDEVKARPGGRIEPLPEVRPAPRFAYEPAGRRSPFLPDSPQAAPSIAASVSHAAMKALRRRFTRITAVPG